MAKEENFLVTEDKLKLYTQFWTTEETPKAVLIIVHGVGDYSKRYENIAHYFCNHNIAVFLFDLRGHGRSEGKKGHVKDYNSFLKDIHLIVKHTSKNLKEIPLFLYGHGIGGNMALNYCISYNKNIKGAIIASPWIRLIKNPSGKKINFIRFLAKIIPFYYVNLDINPDYLTHNQLEVNALKSDPNVFQKITASLFNEIHNACLRVQFNRFKLNIPVLLMHGKKDKITSYRYSKDYSSNTNNIVTKIWDNMYHELHNEPDYQKVLKFVYNWILTVIEK